MIMRWNKAKTGTQRRETKKVANFHWNYYCSKLEYIRLSLYNLRYQIIIVLSPLHLHMYGVKRCTAQNPLSTLHTKIEGPYTHQLLNYYSSTVPWWVQILRTVRRINIIDYFASHPYSSLSGTIVSQNSNILKSPPRKSTYSTTLSVSCKASNSLSMSLE